VCNAREPMSAQAVCSESFVEYFDERGGRWACDSEKGQACYRAEYSVSSRYIDLAPWSTRIALGDHFDLPEKSTCRRSKVRSQRKHRCTLLKMDEYSNRRQTLGTEPPRKIFVRVDVRVGDEFDRKIGKRFQHHAGLVRFRPCT
jgi:hypothetical protein